MRNKPKLYLILLVGLVLLLANSTISCGQNPRYIYENGAVEVGGDDEPIELINNPNATNPTYAELVAFIKEDSTDERHYRSRDWAPGFAYTCADFAEDVHNNAEAAGIKAAWVSIDFEENDEGHALNAFETTDKGLVYIDCTGRRFFPWSPKYNATSRDTVAYVQMGREYGLIHIAEAKSPSYSFYEGYKQKWQEYDKLMSDYNDEVMQYNQEIRWKVYYEGSPELAEIEAWEARLDEKSQELDELGEELGDFWFEPLGIVKDTQIHW